MTFLLRRRRRTRDGSTYCTKRDLDDAPPPYSDPQTDTDPKQDEDPVRRLQSFITQRLVSEYGLSSELGYTNNHDTLHLDLCRRYCLLLGAQFDLRDDVVATKQELMRVIFEPARILDIPADVMEYFLCSTRMFSKDSPEKNCFDDENVRDHAEAILLRLAIDYTIVIDAIVAKAPDPLWPAPGIRDPRKASLGLKLKDKCRAFHQQFYPWMLDLRLIDLEQFVNELKEKDKDANVLVHCKSDTLLDQNYYGNVNTAFDALTIASNEAVSNFDLFSTDSTHEQAPSISFSTNFPSFLLPYRQYTSWPLVTALSYQATRPCSALAFPSSSHNLRISFSDFRLWRLKAICDPNTRFQPELGEIIFRRGFECGLPNKINVGHMEFENPDGGAPKSIIEDGDFEDSWEWKYVVESSSESWSGDYLLSGHTTQRRLRDKSVNPTTDQSQASSHRSSRCSPHERHVFDPDGNNSHLETIKAPKFRTSTNLVRSGACTSFTAHSTLPILPSDPLVSCTSTPSKSHNNNHDSVLAQKEFRDMLFPDLDDLEGFEA